MSDPTQIRIADYDYLLPETSIAQYPLTERDASWLLVFRNDVVHQDLFSNLAGHLPANALLVFNNTKVIRARLVFYKATGSPIEIFCLEPVAPSAELQTAFLQQTGVVWKCLVGNLKRWKSGPLYCRVDGSGLAFTLTATKTTSYSDGSCGILFEWEPGEITFGKVLEQAGLVPLPPYIHRAPESADSDRYQTIYATTDGSVAAPTAGLHFTKNVMTGLGQKQIGTAEVTLHVGVGTFRPVTTELIGDHVMHHERIAITRDTVAQMLDTVGRPIIAVGTTAARTLESLYWLGYQLIVTGKSIPPAVTQWIPYQASQTKDVPVRLSLQAVLQYLDSNELEVYTGETQLMIVPGYQYKLISGLITNFHMPQSTLLLLVAALIGPRWKELYQFAVSNGYRFLSYGDACLFFSNPSLINGLPAR